MNILEPKLDVVFKMIMTDNTNVLRGFLSDILDIPKKSIKKITIKNPNILPSKADGKKPELDLKLKVDDKIVNIEVQLSNKNDFRDRSLFYWAKLFSKDLKQGEDYSSLPKTICVNILDFNLFKKCQSAYSEFQLLEKDRHEKLTDKCSIMFLELSKIDDEVNKNDRKKLWLQFLKAETEEELDMLKQTGVPEIQEAIVTLYSMSASEEARSIAEQRKKEIIDEIATKNAGRAEGIAESIVKGKAEGRVEGIAEGIVKGKAEERADIVAKLLKKGFTEAQITDMLE